MNKFYVKANKLKDIGLEISNQIKDYLIEKGCSCVVMGEMPADTECIIVLGGDGTMIQTARDMAKVDITLIGVNLGTLGYLAEIESDAIYPMLDRLIKDEYEEEERMMLCGLPIVKGVRSTSEFALNDVTVTRSGPLRLVTFIIYVNGKLLKTYGADGIIVSTPTGSTGYNLSAGGPIIEPGAKVLLLTPVNAHTMNARSIILSPEDEVTIEIGPGRRGTTETAEVFFDGTAMVKLESGDKVHIRKAEEMTKILKMSKENFLDVLRRKLADAE